MNKFQTVKQELPTFSLSFRPQNLYCTSIISESSLKVGYLDFRYEQGLAPAPFHSSRMEFKERLYRPIHINQGLTITPEVEGMYLRFGSGLNGIPVDQIATRSALHLSHRMHKSFGQCKHTVEPYFSLQAYTATETPLTTYPLFDMEDAWLSLATARIGLRNGLFCKDACCVIHKRVAADLYTDVFLKETDALTPYTHAKVEWFMTDYMKHTVGLAWDYKRQDFSYFNAQTDYTLNKDFAVSFEFRHRSDYAFRKADRNNFFLEKYHDLNALLNSRLSDRRDAILTRLFYRINPRLATKTEARFGWNRRDEKAFAEFQSEVFAHIRDNWVARFVIQNRVDDFRFSIGLSLEGKPPINPTCLPPKTYRGNW